MTTHQALRLGKSKQDIEQASNRTLEKLLQGVPSQMLFKESNYLSFCAEYLFSKNCFEKGFYCSFCMQMTRSSRWLVLLLQKLTLHA